LSFLVSSNAFTDGLRAYINTKNYDPITLHGALYWKHIPSNYADIINQFKAEKNLQCLGLIIQPSSPVQEIVTALTQAVRIIDAVTQEGIPAKEAINNISFSLSVGTDFFTELAKFKALRMLWYQITQAYEVTDYLLSDLNLHVRSEAWNDDKFKPHGNMLKSTTASMAAVFGGCNSLTVYAEDDNDTMMNRIARNVSTILREESHLNVVADPTAGSYAVDHIIHATATQAWATFIHNAKNNS
jgi:methylmalonyl-CoA mutase